MLTIAQQGTLKTYIQGQGDLAPLASGATTDRAELARLLNLDASPVTKAWLTSADQRLVDEASNWTSFDNLSQGKRDSWRMFFNYPRDFTRAKIRKWITDVWGAASANSDAAALLNAGTENASRAEVALGGSIKTTDTVSALDRAWIGDITIEDLAAAYG